MLPWLCRAMTCKGDCSYTMLCCQTLAEATTTDGVSTLLTCPSDQQTHLPALKTGAAETSSRGELRNRLMRARSECRAPPPDKSPKPTGIHSPAMHCETALPLPAAYTGP